MSSERLGRGEPQLGRGELEGEMVRSLKVSRLLSELFDVKFDDALFSAVLSCGVNSITGKNPSETEFGIR